MRYPIILLLVFTLLACSKGKSPTDSPVQSTIIDSIFVYQWDGSWIKDSLIIPYYENEKIIKKEVFTYEGDSTKHVKSFELTYQGDSIDTKIEYNIENNSRVKYRKWEYEFSNGKRQKLDVYRWNESNWRPENNYYYIYKDRQLDSIFSRRYLLGKFKDFEGVKYFYNENTLTKDSVYRYISLWDVWPFVRSSDYFFDDNGNILKINISIVDDEFYFIRHQYEFKYDYELIKNIIYSKRAFQGAPLNNQWKRKYKYKEQ